MLPFKNFSGEKELDQIKDGVAETLVTGFSGLDRIRVIERAQIQADLGELEFSNSKYVDPKLRAELGKLHGAEVVLLGGLQHVGNVVRANARFVRVETGEVLRGTHVEVKVPSLDSPELLRLQDELTAEVEAQVPAVVAQLRP